MLKEISDIELLKKYMDSYGSRQIVDQNKLTDFGSGDSIYTWTNEPLKEYYNMNSKDKLVLTVTSSGDHLLHAVLAGSKNITAFDINRFCKYYAALKVAMIKAYDYNEFFKMVNKSKKNELNRYLYLMGEISASEADIRDKLHYIYNDVSCYLNDNEKEFWEEYFKMYKQNKVSIFSTIHKEHYINNAYYRDYNYKKIKEKINDCNITYIDSNISDLNKKLDTKFDLIYISNILGRIVLLDENIIFNIINDLGELLNKSGIIYDYNMSYGNWLYHLLGCDEQKVKKMFNKKLPNFNVKHEELSKGSIYKYKLK